MAQRIARAMPMLSQAHRQVADYVQAHPLKVATMPIDELAGAAGVSVATANRFARALEFEGYAQFRAALVLGFESTLAPVERLRSKLEHTASVADVFASALDEVARNAEETRQSLDARSCAQAVSALLKAQRIYVMGYGASSWLGGLLVRNLDRYCENVQLLPSIEGSSYGARMLSRLKATDLVVVISFPRYFSDTLLLARRVHAAGIPQLAITDGPASPLVPLSTLALYARTHSAYFANSEASALALIEALCSAVSHAAKGSLRAAADLTESVLPWLDGRHASRLRPVEADPLPANRQPRPVPRKKSR